MWTYVNAAVILAAAAAIFFLHWWKTRRIRELEDRLKRLETEEDCVFDFLHGIGAAFSEGVRSGELHRLIVESTARILSGSGGALYLAGRNDTHLTAAFVSPRCPPLVPVPLHIRQQASANPAVLEGFIQLQPVARGDGPVGRAWESGETALLPADPHAGLPACAIAPLSYRGKILGVLAITAREEVDRFPSSAAKVFKTVSEQGAFALHNEAVYKEAGEKQRMDRDLEIARDVQRILLPSAPPDFPGYSLATLNLPARRVSGDYFDFIPLGGGRLGVAIADVSGKGIPASLITAMCRGVLRREAHDASSACEVLRRVNSQLYPDLKEDMFISMAYIVLDPASGRILLARAGHDAPLLYRAATGTIEKLAPKGMALGIDSGGVFNRVCADLETDLCPGDSLLLYTDGATETMDVHGAEYGLDRLTEALRASARNGAGAVVGHVASDLKAFVGSEPSHDDITLISISKT